MSLALHLRALGRRNGSNTLAPCHDLSFRQQCWSLLQTRFLVGLPRQVFLEIIILYESGVGEGAVRSAGRRARKERRPSCSGRKPSHGAERCWRSCSCPTPATSQGKAEPPSSLGTSITSGTNSTQGGVWGRQASCAPAVGAR